MRSLFASIVVTLAMAAPAGAQTTIAGADGPGPARYDKVRVVKSGPAQARKVLVLVPGTSASAGNTALIGSDIAKRLKGWQVWSIARRETLLEDHGTFDRALKGQVGRRRCSTTTSDGSGTLRDRPREDPRGRRRGLRAPVGDEGGDRRPPQGDRQGARRRAPRGGPRRALAGRDDRARLRHVGLQGPRRRPRPEGAAADRRRLGILTAQHSRGGARSDREPPDGSPWLDLGGNGLPWTSPCSASSAPR